MRWALGHLGSDDRVDAGFEVSVCRQDGAEHVADKRAWVVLVGFPSDGALRQSIAVAALCALDFLLYGIVPNLGSHCVEKVLAKHTLIF